MLISIKYPTNLIKYYSDILNHLSFYYLENTMGCCGGCGGEGHETKQENQQEQEQEQKESESTEEE